MKHFFCLWAVLASFLVLNLMRCDAARAQENETRAVEIEESAQDASKAGDLKGKVRIKLLLSTEDGQRPEKLLAMSSVNYGPNRVSSSSGNKRLVGFTNEFELLVRAGTLDLCILAEGYPPVFAAKGRDVFAGKDIEFDVTLTRGIPTQLKVVDEDGMPIEKAGVNSYVKFLRLNGSSDSDYGSTRRAGANGIVEVDLPKETDRIYLRVFKSGYASANVEQPVAGEPIEVVLIKSPVTKGVVLDDEGKPLVGATVYLIGSSGMKGPSGNISEREYVTPCAESQFGGRFETDALRKGGFHTLVVETEAQRGVFSGIVAGSSVELKLPPPRKLTFKFLGNREALEPDSILLYQQFRGTEKDDWSSANIWIPFDYDEETGVLTAEGILGCSVTISAGRLGTLYHAEELEDGVDEISINLKSIEQVSRKVKVVFECDGEVVLPRGQLSFRDRTSEVDGIHLSAVRFAKAKDGIVNLQTDASAVVLESMGLVGFAMKKNEEIVELGDVKDGETYRAIIEVEPAGAIHGVVVDSDGKPITTEVGCSFKFVERRSDRSAFSMRMEMISNSEGKFVLTPIPFGAKVEVHAGGFRNKSKPQEFVVDEENPRFEANFQLPAVKSEDSKSKN